MTLFVETRGDTFPTERGVIAAVRYNGKYLLLRRHSKHNIGRYEGVAGKVDEGETHWEAILREMREEANIPAGHINTITHLGEVDTLSFMDLTYTGPLRRWKASLFLVELMTDEDVRINEPDIHDELVWMAPSDFVRRDFSNAGSRLTFMAKSLFTYVLFPVLTEEKRNAFYPQLPA